MGAFYYLLFSVGLEQVTNAHFYAAQLGLHDDKLVMAFLADSSTLLGAP